MNENPESILSTNAKVAGYAKHQDEGEWLVYRSSGSQVGFIMATDIPNIFHAASVPRGRGGVRLVEIEGFQKALAHCLENFRPSPIEG